MFYKTIKDLVENFTLKYFTYKQSYFNLSFISDSMLWAIENIQKIKLMLNDQYDARIKRTNLSIYSISKEKS